MTSAFRGIEELLHRYFDALYDSDAHALSELMHPEAVYATADERPQVIHRMGEYLSIVAARESPRSRSEARRDAVESIEVAGDNTALARVRCSIGDRDFVDFLSLVRAGGRWRIIAKVFHFTQRES